MDKKDIYKMDKIRQYYADNGIMPTIREMTDLFGLSSTNSSWKFIEKMIKAKKIKKVGDSKHKRIAPDDGFFIN